MISYSLQAAKLQKTFKTPKVFSVFVRYFLLIIQWYKKQGWRQP
jgi:hypothetical protein